MKTQTHSTVHVPGHSFRGTICVAAVLLFASSAPAQNLFVATPGAIYGFSPQGAQIAQYGGLAQGPTGLAFNSSGDLFEADYNSGKIYEFTPGGVQSTFASGLSSPYGLAFNSAGDLFEADVGSGNIYKFTPTGMRSTFASKVAPLGLAFNNNGDLFVTSPQKIIEFTPSGVASTFASLSAYEAFAGTGLVFNQAGDLFAASASSSGFIYEFTPAGVKSDFTSGLVDAQGLAINNAGDLFASSGGIGGTITQITPDKVQSTFGPELFQPSGLAFQPVPEPSIFELLAISSLTLFVPRLRKCYCQ